MLISAVYPRFWRGFVTAELLILSPISVGAVYFRSPSDRNTVSSSDLPDTPNPHKTFCVCEWDPFPQVGFTLGYWEPMALVDVSRTPYCFVNLGGTQIHHDGKAQGTVETQTPDQNGSFYYVHVYHFPVLQWVEASCWGDLPITGKFEIAYLSELDPTWRDENLALIVFPETKRFLNPMTALAAQGACLLDSTIANTRLTQ